MLTGWAGDLAGQPGVYFAKILEQLWTGIVPSGAYWTPTRLAEDTRLPALAAHRSEYVFAALDEGEITLEVSSPILSLLTKLDKSVKLICNSVCEWVGNDDWHAGNRFKRWRPD